MKRLDFIRSGAGAFVGLFVGGTKLLAAVRPTTEFVGMDMASGPDRTAWVTVDPISYCDPLGNTMPPHHAMCRCVVPGELIGRHLVFGDGSVRMIVGYDGDGPILNEGRPPSLSDQFIII